MGLDSSMKSLYLILTSIIFPLIVISWLCCLALCIYKNILKKRKRKTNVQVIKANSWAGQSFFSAQILVNDQWSSNNSSLGDTSISYDRGVPDVEAPSEDRLNQSQSSSNFLTSSQGSLLLSDAIKEARRTRHQLTSTTVATVAVVVTKLYPTKLSFLNLGNFSCLFSFPSSLRSLMTKADECFPTTTTVAL